MIRVSSGFYFVFIWLANGWLIPIWTLGLAVLVITGIVDDVITAKPLVPGLIAGGGMVALGTFISVRTVRFMRRFSCRVEIHPGTRMIHFKHLGKPSCWPMSDVSRIKEGRFGRMEWIELESSRGERVRFFVPFTDSLDIRRWGIQSWWEGKLREAELMGTAPRWEQ